MRKYFKKNKTKIKSLISHKQNFGTSVQWIYILKKVLKFSNIFSRFFEMTIYH